MVKQFDEVSIEPKEDVVMREEATQKLSIQESPKFSGKFNKITKVFLKASDDMGKLIDKIEQEELDISENIAWLQDQKNAVQISKQKAERFRTNLDKLFL